MTNRGNVRNFYTYTTKPGHRDKLERKKNERGNLAGARNRELHMHYDRMMICPRGKWISERQYIGATVCNVDTRWLVREPSGPRPSCWVVYAVSKSCILNCNAGPVRLRTNRLSGSMCSGWAATPRITTC